MSEVASQMPRAPRAPRARARTAVVSLFVASPERFQRTSEVRFGHQSRMLRTVIRRIITQEFDYDEENSEDEENEGARIDDIGPHVEIATGSKDAVCAVCLVEFEGEECAKMKACGHSFHRKCIEAWITGGSNRTCPTCRKDPKAHD